MIVLRRLGLGGGRDSDIEVLAKDQTIPLDTDRVPRRGIAALAIARSSKSIGRKVNSLFGYTGSHKVYKHHFVLHLETKSFRT